MIHFCNGALFVDGSDKDDANAKIGGKVTVADCGGVALGETKFKDACDCGKQCSGGYRHSVAKVLPMPQEVINVLDEVFQAKQKLLDALLLKQLVLAKLYKSSNI